MVPSDLFILRDAATIGTEMRPAITREMVVFALAVILVTVALTFVRLPWPKGGRGWALRALSGGMALVCACLFTVREIWHEPSMRARGLGYFSTGLADEYYKGTFVPIFLHMLGDMKIDPPAGYRKTSVEQLAGEMAAQAGERDSQATPDILVVMSESWFDLERVIPGEYSQDLTANFDGCPGKGSAGISSARAIPAAPPTSSFGSYRLLHRSAAPGQHRLQRVQCTRTSPAIRFT